MDDKQYREAFNNNVPDGYDADTYIIVCLYVARSFKHHLEMQYVQSVELS